MSLNINAGRLRHYVVINQPTGHQNESGELDDSYMLFDARAEVLVQSGAALQRYGTEITSQVITVLMWYDERAENDMFIVWEGLTYRIKHIKPDGTQKGMIITAEVEIDVE